MFGGEFCFLTFSFLSPSQFSCFYRLGINGIKPSFPSEPMEANDLMKEVFLSKIINAHSAAYELLYADRMRRAWDEEVKGIVEKFSGKKKKK